MQNKALNNRQVKKIVKEYINILKKDKLPIKEVYLYGSYAKNKANKYSDIDICIISDKYKDSYLFNIYLNEMAVKMGYEHGSYVSPVGFNKKKFEEMIIPLTYEIKKDGKKLKI